MLPQFQMYFRNPVFFYKYIVPQVQIIAQTVVPTTGEDFDFGTETTSRFNPYTTFGYNKYNKYNKWSVPMTESTFGRYPSTTASHYKYLLEKMMRHMNMNKMGQHDITETFTDVKMLPNGHVKESTFAKMVDPITGMDKITVGDVKLVDEKIVPTMDFPFGVEGMTNKYQMNKIFGNTHTIKDLLLKKIILNKIYGDRKVITPEVYETLFGEHKSVYPEVYDMIFKHKNVMTPELLSTIFGNKHVLPETFDTLFDTKKTFTPELFSTIFENKHMTPEIYELLVKGNKHVMTPEILSTIFGKKVYEPEVYGRLFGDDKIFSTENEDVFNKYNVDYEPTIINKMNRFSSPLITRMLKNKVFSPRMNVNMKTMEKYQVAKMIEEIQKERMMEKLIKNKEHKTLFNMDSEIFPTMEEKMTHIPLTFTKPMVGSGIEEFLQQEKEIKY